jgi:hypothetical protein
MARRDATDGLAPGAPHRSIAGGAPARWIAATIAIVLGGACADKKDKPLKVRPADLAGLSAVPASARVVIAADPRRLAESPVVARAIDLMIEREPELGGRIERLAAACGIDWRGHLDSVHLVLTDDAPQPLLVVTGKLDEADVAECVQGTTGAGGGTLSVSEVDGRALYQVTEGSRTIHMAFGRKDTVVLSASRDLVVAGLGTGPKVLDDASMRALIERTDTASPLWAVGRVDEAIGQRLLRLTSGEVRTPPRAFLATFDPSAGLAAELTAIMATEDDAKALESHAGPVLDLIALAVQARGLGALAARIEGARDRDAVRFGIALTHAEATEWLSKVDSRAAAAQDAGPVPAPAGDAGPGD